MADYPLMNQVLYKGKAPLLKELAGGARFEMIDLGVDQSAEKFDVAIREHNAEIVGMSALLMTTMPYMNGSGPRLSIPNGLGKDARVAPEGALCYFFADRTNFLQPAASRP